MHMATDKLTIRPHRTVNVFEMDAAPPGHSESLPDSAKYSVAWELGNAPCKQIWRLQQTITASQCTQIYQSMDADFDNYAEIFVQFSVKNKTAFTGSMLHILVRQSECMKLVVSICQNYLKIHPLFTQ